MYAISLVMPQLRNIKHEKFAQSIARNITSPERSQSPREIYSDVYGSSETSSGNASRLMSRTDIVLRIRYLINQRCSPDFLAKQLHALSKARKDIWFNGKRCGTSPDNAIRLATIQTILKTSGAYHDEESPRVDARSINFQINVNDANELKTIAGELKALNDALLPEAKANSDEAN
jgi:hypothetical protein